MIARMPSKAGNQSIPWRDRRHLTNQISTHYGSLSRLKLPSSCSLSQPRSLLTTTNTVLESLQETSPSLRLVLSLKETSCASELLPRWRSSTTVSSKANWAFRRMLNSARRTSRSWPPQSPVLRTPTGSLRQGKSCTNSKRTTMAWRSANTPLDTYIRCLLKSCVAIIPASQASVIHNTKSISLWMKMKVERRLWATLETQRYLSRKWVISLVFKCASSISLSSCQTVSVIRSDKRHKKKPTTTSKST